jgi:hypothetical protein
MVAYRHQNKGQCHNLMIPDEPFENTTKLKYLGTVVTNQNFIHEEVKRILRTSVSFVCPSSL